MRHSMRYSTRKCLCLTLYLLPFRRFHTLRILTVWKILIKWRFLFIPFTVDRESKRGHLEGLCTLSALTELTDADDKAIILKDSCYNDKRVVTETAFVLNQVMQNWCCRFARPSAYALWVEWIFPSSWHMRKGCWN